MKPLAIVAAVVFGATPLHAQAPAEDIPMLVTGEQRARIAREFADLYKQNETLEEKLNNCRAAQSAHWRSWW